MANLRNILRTIMQRMGAFFMSGDALIFCFFCLFSAGVWLAQNWHSDNAKRQAEEVGATEAIVYTEKTIEVEIRTKGVPSDEELVVFPATVSIKARVTTTAYKELSAEDFRVECSYPQHAVDHLQVKVSCKNKEVASFRYTPEEVEYLILKNPTDAR